MGCFYCNKPMLCFYCDLLLQNDRLSHLIRSHLTWAFSGGKIKSDMLFKQQLNLKKKQTVPLFFKVIAVSDSTITLEYQLL